jgi:ribosome-binding protein aMBF1 (putative translation factor)
MTSRSNTSVRISEFANISQSNSRMCNMANTGYKPVPHDAAFKKALLAKPDVKKAHDALEEEYSTLHAMRDARLTAGLTQADVAARMGTTVSAISRLESSLRSEKHSPSFATLRKYAQACGKKLVVQMV